VEDNHTSRVHEHGAHFTYSEILGSKQGCASRDPLLSHFLAGVCYYHFLDEVYLLLLYEL
jgi:hypothetical protein